MYSDVHLTTKQFERLMMITEFSGKDRDSYIDGLIMQDPTLGYILSISQSSLRASVPKEVHQNDKGVCNVSKVFFVFLTRALGGTTEEIGFNEREFLLYSIFDSTSVLNIFGITSTLLEETYVAIPRLIGSYQLPATKTEVLRCGVCRRQMRSVDSEEGICSGCKTWLQEYTDFRVESFYIPINSLNIQRLEKGVSREECQEVNYQFYEWLFTSDLSGIMANVTSVVDPLQKELPIKEYQKPIY